jgi:hypothetical protein
VVDPDEARKKPGPPPVLWSPKLVAASSLPPWPTGHAVWHRHHDVWYELLAYRALGRNAPDDAVSLVPETPGDGMVADLHAQVDELREMVRKLHGGRP